jgi:hypothetical protein
MISRRDVVVGAFGVAALARLPLSAPKFKVISTDQSATWIYGQAARRSHHQKVAICDALNVWPSQTEAVLQTHGSKPDNVYIVLRTLDDLTLPRIAAQVDSMFILDDAMIQTRRLEEIEMEMLAAVSQRECSCLCHEQRQDGICATCDSNHLISLDWRLRYEDALHATLVRASVEQDVEIIRRTADCQMVVPS